MINIHTYLDTLSEDQRKEIRTIFELRRDEKELLKNLDELRNDVQEKIYGLMKNGVSGTFLSKELGISRSRLYQLRDQEHTKEHG